MSSYMYVCMYVYSAIIFVPQTDTGSNFFDKQDLRFRIANHCVVCVCVFVFVFTLKPSNL